MSVSVHAKADYLSVLLLSNESIFVSFPGRKTRVWSSCKLKSTLATRSVYPICNGVEWQGGTAYRKREDTYLKTNRFNDTCSAFHCTIWYNELGHCFYTLCSSGHPRLTENHLLYFPLSFPRSSNPGRTRSHESHFAVRLYPIIYMPSSLFIFLYSGAWSLPYLLF